MTDSRIDDVGDGAMAGTVSRCRWAEGVTHMDETGSVQEPHAFRGLQVQVFCAALYVAGVAMLLVGVGGALLWAPLLWGAAAGLITITVAFAVRGGRL